MNKKYLPYLLPVRSVVFFLLFISASLITGKELEDLSPIWSVAATVINVLTVVLLAAVSHKSGGYLKLINYEKGKTTRGQVVKMIFLVLFAGMGGMYLAGFLCYGILPYLAPMMIAPVPLWIAIINLILLPVTTALAEDALYLGCGTGCIDNRYVSVIVPAFFFALQHCFIPTLFDPVHMLYRFLSFLPLTLILCIIYRKNRNPLPIMIGHAVIDFATAVMILLTSADPALYEKWCSM